MTIDTQRGLADDTSMMPSRSPSLGAPRSAESYATHDRRWEMTLDKAQSHDVLTAGSTPTFAHPTVTRGGNRTGEPRADDVAADVRVLGKRVLRRALTGEARARVSDEQLRAGVRELSDRAREGGLRAEQVLILVKEAWRYLPEARRVTRDDQGETLARVITLCIDEYYAPYRRR